jgi:hypothetical protein
MILQETFGSRVDLKTFREDLKGRTAPLVDRCSDKRLKPLVSALARNRGTDGEWVSAVGTIVSQRPAASWRESVVIPQLGNFKGVVGDFVHKAVFIGDPPGPIS